MPGRWQFAYSIIPHLETERAGAIAQAYAFQAPLRGISAGLHPGTLPPCGSFIQVEPAEFVISIVKIAEDRRGWLVRGYNTSDQAVAVKLKPIRPVQKAARANLAEESVEALPLTAAGVVEMEIKGYEIVTVRFD